MSLAGTTSSSTYAAEQRLAAHRGATMAAISALTLLPLFAALDTVMFPEHSLLFFSGRACTLLVAAAVLLLLRTELGRRYALLLGILIPITVGLDVDAMTAIAGRETSPYYAGNIVILLGASLLLPLPRSAALAISGILLVGYVLGIVAGGPIGNLPLFATHVLLLASASFLVVVGAAVNEGLRRREFTSRAELAGRARRQSAIAKLGQVALGSIEIGALIERVAATVVETLEVGRCAVRIHRLGPPTRTMHAETGACLEPAHTTGLVIGSPDDPFGVLEIGSADTPPPTADDVDFLEAVTGLLATAIAREQAEAALTEEVRTSTALARVGSELISSLETPVLLERLCQLTAEVLGAAYSTTWLWRPDDEAYAPVSAVGLTPEQWDSLKLLRFPLETVAPLVTRLRNEDVVYLDPAHGEFPLGTKLVERHGGTLAACLAFRRGEDIFGVQIAGFRGRIDPFSAQEERLARGITHLAWMALTNARLVEELERASRLKSEFVSTMSHELRTPLNVIVGYTDLLSDEPSEPDRRKFLTQIRKSSGELLEMIEATLDVSRLAAGKDTPQPEEVRMRELWHELETEFTALPRADGVALRWHCQDDVGLVTDRRKLKIVVKNLVGNALKFTPKGEVVVRCALRDGVCVLTVRDTGIGIPRSHLGAIFEIFRQVDSSDARRYGGVGLGLYIVRSLVTQLGGTISVESAPGAGSSFTAVLPAVLTSTAEERRAG